MRWISAVTCGLLALCYTKMLTGKRAFEGEDVSETLARILMKEPDWTAVPATVPAAVATVMRRCLQKDRKQRLRDIGDAALALDGAFETAALPAPAPVPGASRGARLAWIVAAAAVLAAAALAVPALRHLRETPLSATRVANLSMGVSPAERLGPATFYARPSRTAFAISHDGATIVFGGETTAPNAPQPGCCIAGRSPKPGLSLSPARMARNIPSSLPMANRSHSPLEPN